MEYYVGEYRQMSLDYADTAVLNIDPIPADNPEYGEYTIPYVWEMIVQFRVAGVDDQGRQGDWSLWSVEWMDCGPPGVPDTPQGTLVLR